MVDIISLLLELLSTAAITYLAYRGYKDDRAVNRKMEELSEDLHAHLKRGVDAAKKEAVSRWRKPNRRK